MATLNGYVDWIDDQIDHGKDGYLFTFMFNELAGGLSAKIMQMKEEVYCCYGKLATRIARKPHSPGGQRLLPRLVVYPDVPTYKKNKKIKLSDALVNDGLHLHGVGVASRGGKITDFLDVYFEEHKEEFLTSKLRDIDVTRMLYTPRYMTDYGLKSLKGNRFTMDDVIVLPRSRDELKSTLRRDLGKPFEDRA